MGGIEIIGFRKVNFEIQVTTHDFEYNTIKKLLYTFKPLCLIPGLQMPIKDISSLTSFEGEY